MNPATIDCSYERHACLVSRAVCECVASCFTGLLRPGGADGHRDPVRMPATKAPLEVQLVRAILAVSHARAITGRSDANRCVLERRVAECIRRKVPLAAHMLWSPKKHWVTTAESAIDLAELAAIDTLHSVHNAVRAIYLPGMAFQLDVEDIEFDFIEGSAPDLVQARQCYVDGLRRLVQVLGVGNVFCVAKISDKAVDERELAGWHTQMAANYRALEAYWIESERTGIEHGHLLPSYAALCSLGWIGPIPAAMRDHYLNRFGRVPARGDATSVAMVIRNLAGILLHHQKGLASGRRGSESIKFSFVPPAAGAPAQLLTGRVDLRFVSRKLSSRVSAAGPWSTKGYLCGHNDRVVPAIAGWREARVSGARYVEGRLALVRGGDTAVLRADYLLE